MIRILAVPAAIFHFSLALALLAAPARAVTITGRVLKGAERTPMSGHPISIHVVRGSEELPGSTNRTGSDGAVTFSGLAEGANLEYWLSTEYEGAIYTEGPIPVKSGAGSQDILVYDVAKNFDAVKVQDHHVIVERHDDGLHVTEIVIFQNDANTAYLGVGINHAAPSGMRVGLPTSVKGFKPGLGLDEPSVNLQGRELTSMRPIPPGQRPLSFTYTVPLSGRMDLSHRLYFPTRQMTVLLDDPKLRVESKQLANSGTREHSGKTYAMYVGNDIPVGAEVSVRIGGAGFFSNPKVYPFMVAPFLIAGALWFASRRGSKQLKVKHAPALGPRAGDVSGGARSAGGTGASSRSAAGTGAGSRSAAGNGAGSGNDMADVYLYLIAALDHGVERGDISRESHALVRGNLKRRLEVILADEPQSRAR